jgi:hypothetical protein
MKFMVDIIRSKSERGKRDKMMKNGIKTIKKLVVEG